jgi:hypothetical protein
MSQGLLEMSDDHAAGNPDPMRNVVQSKFVKFAQDEDFSSSRGEFVDRGHRHGQTLAIGQFGIGSNHVGRDFLGECIGGVEQGSISAVRPDAILRKIGCQPEQIGPLVQDWRIILDTLHPEPEALRDVLRCRPIAQYAFDKSQERRALLQEQARKGGGVVEHRYLPPHYAH